MKKLKTNTFSIINVHKKASLKSLNLYDLNSDINKISFEQTLTKIDEKISISPYSLTIIE